MIHPDSFNRAPIPVMERMKQLYAYGYDNNIITQIINNEFEDIMIAPLTNRTVESMILKNKEEFEQLRDSYKEQCRGYLQANHEEIFQRAVNVEIKMVHVYEQKLTKILDSLLALDLDKKDEDGNFVNTYRTNTLIELAGKYQAMIGKLSGNDNLREINMFRQKALIKKATETGEDSESKTIEVGGVIDVKFIQ